jgi:hypothetical protein
VPAPALLAQGFCKDNGNSQIKNLRSYPQYAEDLPVSIEVGVR